MQRVDREDLRFQFLKYQRLAQLKFKKVLNFIQLSRRTFLDVLKKYSRHSK
jgi:hypothetical protein